jgi:hypothetical protein
MYKHYFNILKMNETCCFCLEEITNENSNVKLNCSHIFHLICWNQNNCSNCPLCRVATTNTEKIINQSLIPKFNDNDIIWMFGSFVNIIKKKRKNVVSFLIDNKKYVSGFFWRIFDENIVEQLENEYHKTQQNNTKFKTTIDIGIVNYDVFDEDDTNLYFSNSNFDNFVCVQKNKNKYRPIMRLKWKDAIDNFLIIGINDLLFFENIYIYYHDNKKYFFDIKNQEKINNKCNDIQIDNATYFVDNEQKTLSLNGEIKFNFKIFNIDIDSSITNY